MLSDDDIKALFGGRELKTVKDDEITVFMFFLKQTFVYQNIDANYGSLIRIRDVRESIKQ